MGFAVWMGRMGAAVAAVLAVMWLIEASPDSEHARPQTREEIAGTRCRLDAIIAMNEAEMNPQRRSGQREAAQRFMDACPPQPKPPRTVWDGALATQGLVAGAVAIALSGDMGNWTGGDMRNWTPS